MVAGVVLETSFARSIATMAAFNKARVRSRRFCRLESVFMVEVRGSCEERVWDAGCAE